MDQSLHQSILEEIQRRNLHQPANHFAAPLAGGQPLPNENSFVMENPLNPARLAGLMGLQLEEAPKQVHMETGSGTEDQQTWADAGKHLLLESVRLNQAPANTLPNAAFLRELFIEGAIIRKVARQLVFLPLANRQTTRASDIVWFRDKHANHNDPLLSDPQPIAEGAELPLTVVSDPVKKRSSTGKYGEATIFTDRAIRNTNTAFNEVARKLDAIAYAFSAKINKIYGNKLANKFDATFNSGLPADDQVVTVTLQNPWRGVGSSSANPIEDIRDGALAMEETDEFFYPATEIWLPPKSWKDLNSFATSVDHPWSVNPLTGQRVLQVDEITVRKIPPQAGVPDGKALMLARGPGIPPPLDVWDEVDTRFTRTGLIHVQRVFDPKTLNTWYGFHRTFAVANRNPKAVAVFHGLI
jgi:hypothetical protein